MRLALSGGQSANSLPEEGFSRLEHLPGLCCQAAGGEPDWADELALAWLIFFAAAHLIDSVQDADDPQAWWIERGESVALSAFSGLYFSASLALKAMSLHPVTQAKADEIARDFYRAFLLMGSGQHADLTLPSLTLEQYWQQADTKSGIFFSLACRTGARLATAEKARLEAFASFGRHLGILIQITDDLDDIYPPKDAGVYGQRRPFARSLPVVYALEVYPAQQAGRLKDCLRDAPLIAAAAQEALGLVDQSGAAEYVSVVIEQHKSYALHALELAKPRQPAGDELAALVREF